MVYYFDDLTGKLADYSLFISKETKERGKLRKLIIQHIDNNLKELIESEPTIDTEPEIILFVIENLVELYQETLANLSDNKFATKNQNKVDYTLIDLAYIYYVSNTISKEYNERLYYENIDKIAEHLRSIFDNYKVIHEEATLCWSDRVLKPTFILNRLNDYDLTDKELFHILGELSLTFPNEVIDYLQQIKLYDKHQSLVERMYKKMTRDRERSKPLVKNINIEGDLEEIKTGFHSNFGFLNHNN